PVVAHYGPRRIDRPRQVIERLDPMTLAQAIGKVRHAPRFVERHPGDDARMTVVAIDRVEPFAGDAVDRFPRESVRAWHFIPDEQAEVIRPEQIPRIFELLVFANAVEAHRLRQLDVASE